MTKSSKYQESWTPERRAAQAERMRAAMTPERREANRQRRAAMNRARAGTPEGAAVGAAMSRAKTGKAWTPEARIAQDAANAQRGQSIAARWTPERRQGQAQKNRDMVWTPEMRERRAEQSAIWWADNIRDLPYTERYFAALLEYAEMEFEPQRRFGRYVVDFFIPASNAVIEIDGDWPWHRDGEREARRDAYLLERGVAFVNHIPTDLMWRWHGNDVENPRS